MRRHQRLDKLVLWLGSFDSQANPSWLIRELSKNASLARYKIKMCRVEPSYKRTDSSELSSHEYFVQP
jgi:hypothetical protein